MNRNWIIGIIGIIIIVAAAIFVVYQPQVQNNTVTFSLTGVSDVSPAHLEGWAIFGEEKVSTGKFNVGGDLTFTTNRDLSTADSFAITIEAEDDTDDQPSGIVLLSGSNSEGGAMLAFPTDFSNAEGTYILATPTNGADTDEVSGIWFLALPEPPTVSLTLPMLDDGWVYEGWVVNNGVPITSGKFSSVVGVDLFDGYSSTQGGPPFPGEDFLVNAPSNVVFPLNLANGDSLAVISVEPDLNGVDPTGAGPFLPKPLVGNIPLDADDHVNYDMDQNLGSIPSGSALIS